MGSIGAYVTISQVLFKAGANANATAITEPYVTVFVGLAEGVVNTLCRRTFASTSTAFGLLPAGTRAIISDVVSNLAAIDVIKYDMSGFSSRTEAEDMLNVLRDGATRDMKFLEDKKNQDFLMTGVSST